MNKIISFLFFFLFSSLLFSQGIKKSDAYYYARKIVDTMASESMHGRGYVNEGDKIAANYIKAEFQKLGLISFANNYYQSFSFPVNTFPTIISAEADTKKLVASKDFIISSNSPSSTGKYLTVVANDKLAENKRRLKKFKKQDFTNKILIVDDTEKVTPALHELLGNSCKAKAIVVLKDKLTWSVSQSVNDFPSMEILRTSIDKPTEINFTIENKFIPEHSSQNIIGYVKGSSQPDSFIVFSAHYDHLGQMGKDTYFPGANDNASGCAMLLNLARYYSMPEHQPKCSVVFMAFCGEEAGLLGSKYYVEHPLFPLKQIKFLLNMDIMGTGEDGITVVNGTIYKKEFDLLKQINSENNFIKEVKIRGKAANSDHYHFSEHGVRACFIYTMGGIKAYHDIYDKPETLPLNEFEDLFQLIVAFENTLSK